jgi:hypothetical protein
MNFIKRIFIHGRFHLAAGLLVIFYLGALPSFLTARVTVIEGNKENIKTGKLLSRSGSLDIGDFLAASEITRSGAPVFKPVKGDKTLVALCTKDKTLIIDTVNHKQRRQLNLPSVLNVYRFEGGDFFLVVHNEDTGKKISRFDTGSQTPAWTVPFDIEDSFTWGKLNVYKTLPFPVTCRYVPGKKQLFLAGITFLGKGRKLSVRNKILLLDAGTGRTIREHDFHYRRYVDKDHALLVDKENKQLELMDFNNGESTMKASYNDSVLPDKKNWYYFSDYDWLYPVKPSYGGQVWLGYEFHKLGWEFGALLTSKGLMISARKFADRLKPGVKISHWSMINLKTGEAEPVNPCPNSGLDMALLNVSGKKWPVIVPQRSHWKGWKIADIPEHIIFWRIDRDGSMKQFTVPTSAGENVRLFYNPNHSKKWCHDGEYLYFLHSGKQKIFKKIMIERKLLRVKIGGDKAEEIHTYADKEEVSYILSGDDGHVVLSGKDRGIMVQVPQGKEITGTGLPGDAGQGRDIPAVIARREYAITWMQAIDTFYLHKHILKTDLP